MPAGLSKHRRPGLNLYGASLARSTLDILTMPRPPRIGAGPYFALGFTPLPLGGGNAARGPILSPCAVAIS